MMIHDYCSDTLELIRQAPSSRGEMSAPHTYREIRSTRTRDRLRVMNEVSMLYTYWMYSTANTYPCCVSKLVMGSLTDMDA
jgi:hypothetical protein